MNKSMLSWVCGLLLFFVAPSTFSSSKFKAVYKSKTPLERITNILERDLAQTSPKVKKSSYNYLVKIFDSKKYALAERWRATVTLARFFPKSDATSLALESKTWFLRNSALLGLAESSPKRAVEWASRYIAGDKSLVVRTAAVDILKKWPSRKVQDILRRNVDNKRNFKNGQPLWIRKNILKALYSMSTKEDLPGIMSELKNNPDQQHVQYLLKELPRISGQSINTSPFDSERKAWLNWWEINKKQLINR